MARRYAPKGASQQSKSELDLNEIAEEASKEQDGTNLVELTNKLINDMVEFL